MAHACSVHEITGSRCMSAGPKELGSGDLVHCIYVEQFVDKTLE